MILELVDSSGRRGLGEASPLAGYSPDTPDEAAAALAAWAPHHARRDVTSPAARFAIETAELDLIGRRRGVSIATLLRGAPHGELPLAALVADLAGARAARSRGVTTFKVKVGAPGRWSDELALLTALRAEHGRAVTLRADANRRIPLADAPARLAELAAAGVDLVEEPVAELAALTDSPIPLAQDESLQAPTLFLSPLTRVLVLKPTTLGGFARCLALARLAARRGLGVYVTHCQDGPIAVAAACELALALPERPLPCGLDRHHRLVPQLHGASIRPAALPGLGLP